MIRKEINGTVITINDNERQECEVWTRVMGYYRTVKDFNIGKKQEFKERKYFKENNEKILNEKGKT